MTSSSPSRTGAFISYSHQDKKFMGELRRHLDYLEREGKINVWDDTKIKPGSNWREVLTSIWQRIAKGLVGNENLTNEKAEGGKALRIPVCYRFLFDT